MARDLPASRARGAIDLADLEIALTACRASGDQAGVAVAHLAAAERLEAAGALEAACFERVQAYVYALEAGSPLAEAARASLAAQGRER